ncbi:hydrogenase accessory protein [Thalassobius sp. S69A]|uniref:hydrogenase accessory protein n=1 Tax=unclassified Thalassovita TaxID=2619711 RepID=UPI000C0EFF91|nr:hydrogenase accessory protein [Paracoccaceae bacterium]MBT25310.1 hydrogenase accessory protein [Paracoccaceae bacterium]
MTHPLIARLTDDMCWPALDDWPTLETYTAQPGTHALFVPGDPKRNLETADVAVILPELKMAFQGLFDCAVVGNGIETKLREQTRVLKTPSLIFYRDGQMIGAIPRVRDWDEYIARIKQILAQPALAD